MTVINYWHHLYVYLALKVQCVGLREICLYKMAEIEHNIHKYVFINV